MDNGQKMFRDFFMNMVQEGKETEAEIVLSEGFEKQKNGNFNADYLKEIMPKYYALIKPEYTEQLKQAMEHFSSNL